MAKVSVIHRAQIFRGPQPLNPSFLPLNLACTIKSKQTTSSPIIGIILDYYIHIYSTLHNHPLGASPAIPPCLQQTNMPPKAGSRKRKPESDTPGQSDTDKAAKRPRPRAKAKVRLFYPKCESFSADTPLRRLQWIKLISRTSRVTRSWRL